MQYEVQTPDEYLKALDDDWRRGTLLELRKLIRSTSTSLNEGIQYKMLAYFLDDRTVFQLNAQKNYVSLYVGDHQKIDPELRLLKGLNVGKGCIRFSKTISVSDTHIDLFISKAVEMAKAGKDIGC